MSSRSAESSINSAAAWKFYDAIAEGDHQTALDCMDKELLILEPTYMPYGGRYEGLHKFIELFPTLREHVNVDTLKIDNIIADADKTIAVLRADSAVEPATELRIAESFGYRNGKIVEAAIYFHDLGPLTPAVKAHAGKEAAATEHSQQVAKVEGCTSENKTLVEELYAAVSNNQIQGLLDVLDPNLVVYEPTYLPYGGRTEGLNNFVELYSEIIKYIDIPGLTLDEVIAEGENVVGLVRANCALGGPEVRIAEHFTVRDGKVVEITLYFHEIGRLIEHLNMPCQP